ncbi:MAG: Gldg family protein, partial [Nevskiaceae bacterium]
LNLATDPRVPDNTAVLVLAAPARPLLDGEVKIVDDYVRAGGNLLWLADPAEGPRDPVASLAPLAATLGITWLKGTGILLESASLGLPPFVYITTQYPPNPVTRDFPENALFALVRGLNYTSDPAGFTAQPLLTTSEHAWLETGRLEGELAMDARSGDTEGPLTLGVTLTRELKPAAADPPKEGEAPAEPAAGKPQRVALVGDSDFLSNAYVGQLGNGLLGLNLAQWLASRDELLNIDVPKAPDLSLVIPAWGLYAIYIGFAFLLPAVLLGFGVTRWVIRRRA